MIEPHISNNIDPDTAIKGLKLALDVFDRVRSFLNDSKSKEKTIQLNDYIIKAQNALLGLQSDYPNLLIEYNSLRQKIVGSEDWKIIESQYKPYRTQVGSLVHSPNENHPSPVTGVFMTHVICNAHDQILFQ